VGEQIDIPENFNHILLRETGDIIVYEPLTDKDIQLVERFIDEKKRYITGGIYREPDRLLYSLSASAIFGQLGVIYIPEKRAFVSEATKEWLLNLRVSPYTHMVNFPPKTSLKGITLSCLTNGADAGFYHFMFESIVKVKFAERIIPYVDFLLFNGPSNEWKQKWLIRAGVDIRKVIWVDNNDHYACEQLLFTSRMITDQQISKWCINTLRVLLSVPAFKQPGQNKLKVFFISRRDFVRNIEWENAIMEQYPFIERIDFSKLDPDEAIARMAEATHVIGPHGAALGNIFLCRPGTRILEIYPLGKTYQPCYYRICAVCDLQYAVAYLNFKDKSHPINGLVKIKAVMDIFLENIT
jgi:hypothetical protein